MLDAERELAGQLRGTLMALIQVLNPYHSFAATVYNTPLSPPALVASD
jgi:hypothetical protein